MSEDTGFQFTDDAVPRAYEDVLVPRLFEPWALLLLDECNLGPNAVVLDVATGPGTVARVTAKRIGPGGRVVFKLRPARSPSRSSPWQQTAALRDFDAAVGSVQVDLHPTLETAATLYLSNDGFCQMGQRKSFIPAKSMVRADQAATRSWQRADR